MKSVPAHDTNGGRSKDDGIAHRSNMAIGTITLIALLATIAVVIGVATMTVSSCGCTQVRYVSAVSVSLYAGTASTNRSQGNAELDFSFNNPGSPTTISSIALNSTDLSLSPRIYQCESSTSCIPISSSQSPDWTDSTSSTSSATFSVVTLLQGQSSFNTPTTAFFFSSPIKLGSTYNYIINFGTGQSISGSLFAQSHG